MDLNQLYYDHQLSLMRAKAADIGPIRQLHRRKAQTFAAQIARIHLPSGATALRGWKHPAPISAIFRPTN